MTRNETKTTRILVGILVGLWITSLVVVVLCWCLTGRVPTVSAVLFVLYTITGGLYLINTRFNDTDPEG